MPTTKTKRPIKAEWGNEQSSRLAYFRKKFIAKSSTEASEILKIERTTYWRMETGRTPISSELLNILQKKYNLNTDFIISGLMPIQKDKPNQFPGATLAEVNVALNTLEKMLKIMQINQNIMFDKMEAMEKEIERLKKG
ncbi:hypothetical protein D9M68_569710 [compost metagenome]